MNARRLLIVVGLLSTLLLSTTPAAADDLKSAVDRAIRWLNARENDEGSFGSGDRRLTVTAAVLAAYAHSPRQYREDDGPFVRRPLGYLLSQQSTDGSFGSDDQKVQATGLAIEALEALGADRHASALERARQFLGVRASRDGVRSYFKAVGLPDDSAAWARGRDEVQALVRSQLASGAWSRAGSQSPDVERTAGAALLLSLAARSSSSRTETTLRRSAGLGAAERGVTFLLSQQKEGRWMIEGQADLGLTGMALTAVLMSPQRPEGSDAVIEQALDFIRSSVQSDGGIHQGRVQNYVTCVSLMALKQAGRPEDRERIRRAARYIESLQANGDQGYEPDDKFYGGIGYGGDQRPDLSNLQFSLEALTSAGVSPEDQAIRDALVFLQRCQNRSESNPNPVKTSDGRTMRAGNDGGSAYYPGNSDAGYIKNPDGTFTARSYGSMTYALLRGYLFAGLSPDDPRVQEAVGWISRNYTVEYNPGFDTHKNTKLAYQGLYYYYLTMAKALAGLELDFVVDESGEKQDWRSDLVNKLTELQRADGAWINDDAERWWEGNPVLATAYAVQTLAVCLPNDEETDHENR